MYIRKAGHQRLYRHYFQKTPYAVYSGRLRTIVWLLIDAFGPDMLGGLKPSF